jgi:cytochrome oxidase Cu insertion factor (SCO1/SenC/PrrC family)
MEILKMMRMKKRLLALFASMLVALCGAAWSETTMTVLAQSSAKTQRQQVVYACPMHPEVKAKKRGKCPKCNMNLEPVRTPAVATKAAEEYVGDARGNGSSEAALRVPDTIVLDQHGKRLRFYSDLVKGKTVAINFVFTTCKGVCPTLAAKFRQVQQELGERIGRDIQLISISVDPTTDVPERLSSYAEKFHAGPGWTFVTGSKPEIDELLRALGAFSPDKVNHPQTILIGNEVSGYWTRTLGLTPAREVAQIMLDATKTRANAPSESVMSGMATANASSVRVSGEEERSETASPSEDSAAYFPNLPLLTQGNKPVRFYNDLLKGKVVLVNFMFTTCKGVCSPMTANLAKVQRYLGDRVGHGINMISISVDPETDTAEVLKRYAATFKAQPGWYFLTGKKENVDWVLYKMGGYVEDKGEHSSVLIIGNEATGEWLKMPAMANPEEIANAAIKLAEPKSN